MAYSQSEKNIADNGFYDFEMKQTPLPHKTIALLSGLRWIGKNNLLITPDHGCAISISSVLTNAPLATANIGIMENSCGNCSVCVGICPVDTEF